MAIVNQDHHMHMYMYLEIADLPSLTHQDLNLQVRELPSSKHISNLPRTYMIDSTHLSTRSHYHIHQDHSVIFMMIQRTGITPKSIGWTGRMAVTLLVAHTIMSQTTEKNGRY